MQEAFLHHIWQYKKFELTSLKSAIGEEIQVINCGQLNTNAGPDFLNAQVRIGGQLWAGNIEIHLKSSDWYAHKHEEDTNYDNVILHVVWQHDVEVFQKSNTPIPTLELQPIVDFELLNVYNRLLKNQKQFINCENNIDQIDDFTFNNWIHNLFIERLQSKAEGIKELLYKANNNWEATLFQILFKGFGLKVNGETFLELAKSIDFSVIRKLYLKGFLMEALFLGQADLLNSASECNYEKELHNEFIFLKNKFSLEEHFFKKPEFFRLRPTNFPTLRLSQLASLYSKEQHLFSKLMNCKNLDQYYDVLKVGPSQFWQTHYTFRKASKKSNKILTKSFIDLLIMNAILPLRFIYNKEIGVEKNEEIIQIISEIKREKNSLVDKFHKLRSIPNSALFSQGIIQLKTTYCDKNKCLQCAVGNKLLMHN